MITTQHYSARHWHKQRAEIDRYIDSLNERDDRISGRRPRIFLSDMHRPVNPGFEGTTEERLKKLERIKELRASAGDLLKHAHVNFFKMANDPLRANDISFGVMLDDLKKELHTRINDRFENERIETEKKDRLAKATRSLLYNIQDAARYMRYGVIDKPRYGQPITLLGQAITKTSQAFNEYYKAMAPTKISFDKGSPEGDKTVVTMVGEKGREILSHNDTADALKYAMHRAAGLPDYEKASKVWRNNKKYYAAYMLTADKSIKGKRIPDFMAARYDYEFKSVIEHNTYFVCNSFHWKQYSKKPMPNIGERTTSKNGHTWIRVR